MLNVFSKRSRKELVIVIACAAFVLCGFTVMSVAILVHDKQMDGPLVIGDIESTYSNSSHVPLGTSVMSEEEWGSSMGTTSYATYDEYLAATSSFNSTTPTITADGINMELFQYCDQYFKAYYGTTRISPLYPMALSNIETSGRADFSVAWSALLPTKVVPPEQVGTFDVTSVVADDKVFRVLSSEMSTRDRGCLQMSPTYGTNNEYLNSLMSGTEKEKLSKVDTSKYSGWASGASSQPGDRFYLPDVLMRLQAATEQDVSFIVKNGYTPSSDMSLLSMLAVSHNTGYAFYYKDRNHSIGRWKSEQHLYDYCEKLGQQEFVSKVEELANSQDAMYISPNTANKLYSDVYRESYTQYCSGSVPAAYPIMVMYAYMRLANLYTQ